MKGRNNPGSTRAIKYLRVVMLVIALALPLLSLVVLGSLWLWQNDYVVLWAAGALATTACAFGVERWLLRDAFQSVPIVQDHADTGPAFSSTREQNAWQAVLNLTESTKPETIDNRDALIDLGKRTVEAVARQMHPEHKDPLLKFTLPEAFALVQQVTGKLAPFVRDNIPLGDRLTIGQFLAIYRWRGILDFADKAYDIWRIVRLLNPAAAVTQELRESVTRQLYDWGRKELAEQLTTAYIREVGRAAIDLYSGRLRNFDQHGLIVDGTTNPPAGRADHDGELKRGEFISGSEEQVRNRRPSAIRGVARQAGNAVKLLWRRKK